ncbi:MAG: hypothetical protein HRT94_02740 [Alphaproteobacteria bacterium]|nr:hypothetical protein [Alphaproteobacteria bacterium]
MTQQSAFLIKTLEKIGAPLAAAIEEVSQRTRGDMEVAAREVEDAKIMAQLLGQTVQVSLSLGGALIQASDEEKADAQRLAVASLIAPIIANYYRQNGEAPDDAALGRITKSLEASVAFAENFNPSAEDGARLSILGEDTLIFDSAQKNITALDALVPVVKAIGEFPFGHSETKLLQEVSGKLKEKAAAMNIGGDALSEMLLLKSLAKIYSDCHLAEVQKLSQSSNEERGELSIDPVWQAFDTRVAMVGVLLGMAPAEQTTAATGGAPNPVAEQPVPAQPSPAAAAPVTPPAQPVAQPTTAPAAPAGGGNPMSFFSGGGDNAAPSAPAASAQPTAQAPSAPTQPTTAPAVPTQPAAQPPAAPAGGGNPMSFFKPGSKPAEGSEDQAGA